MARIGRWGQSKGPQNEYPDGGGPADLRSRHLILLPTTATPAEVAELVKARVPDADLARDGEARMGRHCRIHGPYHLTMEDAVDAGVPMPWTLAYAIDAPVEREDPPLPGDDDRDGFAHAFPDGLPWKEEARALQLAIGIARRLHGAVRVSMTTATGAMITPDPNRAVDVLIHAPQWLDPHAVHNIVAQVVPGAELAIDGRDWRGPEAGLYQGEGNVLYDPEDPLSPHEHQALHAAADEFDMAAMAAEDVIDAYAVVGPVGYQSMDGEIDVLVHVTEGGEPSVADQAWSSEAFVTYEVRWACPEPQERENRTPSAEYVALRERVRPLIHDIARSLVEASGGVVTDEEGYPLNRYRL